MSDNHGHSDHGHGDHGHGHGAVAGVIPEGSWQDKLLMAVAAGALAGLLWTGYQFTLGCPVTAHEGHESAAAAGDGHNQDIESNDGTRHDVDPDKLKPIDMPPDVDKIAPKSEEKAGDSH